MIVAAYILICLALAWVNYFLIGQGKRIYHGLNGCLHIICWAVVFYITRSWLLLAALPFLGRVFFDTALNLMRNLPIDYVPMKPKSIMDQWEKKLFKNNGILPKVIYLSIAIILTIIYATTTR